MATMAGRPVFGPVNRGVSTVELPAKTTVEDAARGLTTMLQRYKPGRYVYEEVWMHRAGRADPNAGDLTAAETTAILSGDPARVRGIRVNRFLWKVAKLDRARSIWLRAGAHQAAYTPAYTVVLCRCDRPNDLHLVTIDEVGVRFSQSHTLDGPAHLVAAFRPDPRRRRRTNGDTRARPTPLRCIARERVVRGSSWPR